MSATGLSMGAIGASYAVPPDPSASATTPIECELVELGGIPAGFLVGIAQAEWGLLFDMDAMFREPHAIEPGEALADAIPREQWAMMGLDILRDAPDEG